MKGAGVGRREMMYGHFDKSFLIEQIRKHRQEIDQLRSDIEGISHTIEYLYGRMKTAKGPERQEIYQDIQKHKSMRSRAYELIKDHREDIADIKSELGHPARR